ncbi:GyrI-like domain-containing protein [Pseudoalteromonas sp.]|uniref:AraC family transcriptional regulator n=1 Tax=Pseudoalteromonas sp. TaxID=53249 RepID=UPI003563029E
MTNSTTQFNAAIISKVAQYIYDHSEEAINVEALAEYAGFSKYHFNRLFFAATGFQLGEFIKRQKLEKAMFLLKSGHTNILEVAMSIGYDSPSSFTRAFKTNFACTPSDIQNGKSPLNVRAGNLPPKKLAEDSMLEPQWRELPDTTVLGFYGTGFNDQSFSKVAGQLYKRLSELAKPLDFSELQPIGVAIDNPWVGEQTQSQFFAGFLNGLTQEQQLEHYTLQGGRYACFCHQGPHSTMWQTISKVYAHWVLPNQIRLKDQHIVQCYLNNPADTDAEKLSTELYFAVESDK